MAGRFALQPVDESLLHYGVKGMKWGVRRNRPSAADGPQDVSVKARPGKLVKTSGGKFHGPSDDAVEARVVKQKIRSSSLDSVSNKELQTLVTRMNLEQSYERMKKEEHRMSRGMKLAKALLTGNVAGNASFLTETGLANAPEGLISDSAASKIRKGAAVVEFARTVVSKPQGGGKKKK